MEDISQISLDKSLNAHKIPSEIHGFFAVESLTICAKRGMIELDVSSDNTVLWEVFKDRGV